MPDDPHTASTSALIFRLLVVYGRLLAAGDALMEGTGLTSARWRILGQIALLSSPETVSGLAKRLGLARQSVQRVVDELVRDGLLDVVDNPTHRRAHLVVLTEAGRAAHAEAERRRLRWTAALAEHLDPADTEAALRAVRSLEAALGAVSPEDHR